MNEDTAYDPQDCRDDQKCLFHLIVSSQNAAFLRFEGSTHGVEHGMEKLLRTMQAHINGWEEDHTRRREDEEGKSSSLGLGMPGVSLLEVLEGIDCKEKLGDWEEEHDSEEYRNGGTWWGAIFRAGSSGSRGFGVAEHDCCFDLKKSWIFVILCSFQVDDGASKVVGQRMRFIFIFEYKYLQVSAKYPSMQLPRFNFVITS